MSRFILIVGRIHFLVIGNLKSLFLSDCGLRIHATLLDATYICAYVGLQGVVHQCCSWWNAVLLESATGLSGPEVRASDSGLAYILWRTSYFQELAQLWILIPALVDSGKQQIVTWVAEAMPACGRPRLSFRVLALSCCRSCRVNQRLRVWDFLSPSLSLLCFLSLCIF